MKDFNTWYEAHKIAGKGIKTREDGLNWRQLKVEINKLIDIILDPNVDPQEKAKAKVLAAEFSKMIDRAGMVAVA